MKDAILCWLILLGFAMLFVAGPYLWRQQTCISKWEHRGIKVEYGLFKGCLVQRKDGTWVPDDMLREFVDGESR